eukprot:SAG31_NODE_229_length_19770_cov_9.887194_11_plen_135_part_00
METIEQLQAKRNGLAFRVVTTGLLGVEMADRLITSGVVATASQSDQRRETRLQTVSVALQCESPGLYDELYSPPDGKGFADVCSFIGKLSEAGVEVEVTAVDRPEVNISATRALALALGASSFRSRSYFPRSSM